MQGPPIRLSRPTAALLTTMLAVSGLPSFLALGSGNPEISDESGDVNPAAFFASTPENQAAFDNFTAYDLEKVYILLETATDLLIQFQVRDLPDKWNLPAALPPNEDESAMGANASQPAAVVAANFTVRGSTYEAKAILAQPTGQGLRDSYQISRDGSDPVNISGSYDVDADTVTLSIRKELLGSPRNYDVLSKFRAEGRFGEVKLDFAPDAVDYEPGTPGADIVTIILDKLQGQQVVQPQFGRDYTFNYRPGTGDVQLSSPSTEATIGPGGTHIFTIEVRNRGAAQDTIMLTLSAAGAGYHHRLGDTEIILSPGQSQNVLLTVSTAESARGTALSIVEARSRLGDSEALVFETNIVEGAPVATTGSSNPIEQTNPPEQSPEDEESSSPFEPTGKKGGGSPGFQTLFLVMAGAAAVAGVAWRTRRG